MSKVVKGIGKVFKKVVRAVAKPLLIASAVFFTGGLAAGAFPAVGAFAAKSGLTAVGGALGKIPIVGQALTGAGKLGSGIGSAVTGASPSIAASSIVPAAPTSPNPWAGAIPGGAPSVPATTAATGSKGIFSGAVKAFKGMSTTDKLIAAQIGLQAVSGLTAPTLDQEAEAQRKARLVEPGYNFGQNQPLIPTAKQQIAQHSLDATSTRPPMSKVHEQDRIFPVA